MERNGIMKSKAIPVIILAAVFAVMFVLVMWVITGTAKAEDGPPAPYAGLTNPLPWNDPSGQQAGKQVFQASCLGCHGATGRNLPTADFGAPTFSQQLEQRPDLYFWVLSEGRLTKGMPPFKSTLSEEKRWQVLTYMWSLGKVTAPPQAGGTVQMAPKPSGRLTLAAPAQAVTGQPVAIAANLKDEQGKALAGVDVDFYVKVDFFTSGLMMIGEATTDSNGTASVKFSPTETGPVQVVARYQAVEADSTVTLTGKDVFYQPEAGIRMPGQTGHDVFIGSHPVYDASQPMNAPTGAFRLPGGIPSWLLLIVFTILLIWGTYFRVFYQVLRIPAAGDITDTDTRLVPRVIMTLMVLVGSTLALIVLHGPYTHLHLMG